MLADVSFHDPGNRAQCRLDVLVRVRRTHESVPAVPVPRLAVPTGNRIVFVNFDEIDWIQAADQYVIVHVAGKEHLMRESLQRLAARLPRERFAQIHRSHIVNLSKVKEVRRLGNGDAEITLAGGRALRMSRRYRHEFTIT